MPIYAQFFRRAVFTRTLCRSDLVFDMRSEFINRSAQARLQVSVCSCCDLCHPGWHPARQHTDTFTQTAFDQFIRKAQPAERKTHLLSFDSDNDNRHLSPLWQFCHCAAISSCQNLTTLLTYLVIHHTSKSFICCLISGSSVRPDVFVKWLYFTAPSTCFAFCEMNLERLLACLYSPCCDVALRSTERVSHSNQAFIMHTEDAHTPEHTATAMSSIHSRQIVRNTAIMSTF